MSQDEQQVTLNLVGTTRSLDAWSRLLSELLLGSNQYVQSGPAVTEMSRADIIEIVKALRRKVDFNRDTILAELSNNRGINLNIALDIAIQASCMTETGVTKKHTTYNKSLGAYWNGKESFVTYMDRSYPQTIDSEGIALTKTDQNALKGWKLAKKLGIKFKGTNNLADHLFYSRQRNTLYIFHHVGFLNAHLGNRAYDIPLDSGMKTCLEM